MKKLRIFNYMWHASHQYSLIQLPDTKWTWIINNKREYFSKNVRGDIKSNINLVTEYEKGKYDLAILHIDQQVTEGIWNQGKSSLYRQLNEVITDIPKIVINHGT